MQKNSFLKRGLSLLLVAVMMLGMLPAVTTDVFAGGSGSGSGGHGDGGSGNVYEWSGTSMYFTRFTLIKINTDDDDSVIDLDGSDGKDSWDTPISGASLFGSSRSEIMNNIEVIGSINVNSTEAPVTVPVSSISCYNTNLIGYYTAVAGASSATDAVNAVKAYITGRASSSFELLDWSTVCNDYATWCPEEANYDWPGNTGGSMLVQASHASIPSWTHDSDPDDLLMVSTKGTQTDTYYSSTSGAFRAICASIMKRANLTYESVDTPYGPVNSIFRDDDGVTYRLIIEDGTVVVKTGTSTYRAVTLRDTIGLGLQTGQSSGFGHDIGWSNAYTLANGLKGDADNFYGYKYDTVAKDWQQSNNLMDNGTITKVFEAHAIPGTYKDWINGSGVVQKLWYPALGLDYSSGTIGGAYLWGAAIYVPYYHVTSPGLTIKKTVVSDSEEDLETEWTFDVEIYTDTEPAEDAYTVEYTSSDGTTGEAEPISGEWDGEKVLLNVVLKSGMSAVIEGLPEDAKFTVTETNGGSPNEDEFYASVTNTGAEDTGEQSSNYTEGTLSSDGSAIVSFTNAKAGEAAHIILDYNLPGAAATIEGQEKWDEIVAEDAVDCGVYQVGDEITIKASINGTPLTKGTQIQVGDVTFTFQGIYTAATGGDYIGDDGATYALKHGDLTVLYCQWDSEIDLIDPIEGEGQLYTIYWDYNYDGGGKTSCTTGTWTYEGEIVITGDVSATGVYNPELSVTVEWSQPSDPIRDGYYFSGWALEDPNADEGEFEVPDPGYPGGTYYAVWTALDIVWDGNGGTWSDGSTRWFYDQQVWHEEIPVVSEEPTRTGYTFNGWYMDEECSQPIETYEEGVLPGRTYYAGWTAEKVIVTYYDTRQGTGAIVRQDEYNYNDILDLLDGMNSTDGWTWVEWQTKDGVSGTDLDEKNLTEDTPLEYHPYYDKEKKPDDRDPALMSDAGYWTLDFYAIWKEETTSYTLDLVWNDFQNNDGARPKTVTVGLVDSYMNNEVIQTNTVNVDPTADKQTLTVFTGLPVEDNDASVQKRTYKLVFLGYTDYWGTYYEMEAPAIDGDKGVIDVQTVSLYDNRTLTQYAYGVNNYGSSSNNSANTGYEEGNYYTIITFDHALITTGDDIKFTIQWDDDSNNDGVRPQAVTLVLYADGIPVYKRLLHNSQTGVDSVSAALCEVTNDGDTWTYIFPDYQKYNNGVAINYTVAVKNDDLTTTFDQNDYTVHYLNSADETIGDKNGCFISRPIEYQEVPISIIWNDENNRDGQRPEYVSVALMAYQWNDHTFRWEYEEIATQVVRTDNLNHMTASEWTATFGEQKVYNDGLKRIYHLVVLSDLNEFIPEGSFQYGWVESLYGNQREVNGNDRNGALRDPVAQVMISQNTNTVSVTGNVYWDDSQNNDNIRPVNVILQLYAHAPGETPEPVEGQEYRVTLCGISCSQVPTPTAGLPDLR